MQVSEDVANYFPSLNRFPGACGVYFGPFSNERPEDWVCDLCQNEKTQEASLVSLYIPICHFGILS